MTAYHPISLKEMRAAAHSRVPPRLALRVIAIFVLIETLFLFALSLTYPTPAAAAEPIKGEVNVSTTGGYARLVIRMTEEVEANVRLSGGIIVISFKQPVSIPLDRINASAPEYISAARRDPDGKAIRLALARRVKINSIAAAERLFVDLMPENWTGIMPGLPEDVVEELARRTREAERQLRQQRLTGGRRSMQSVRVRVGSQPTFVRYMFELPDSIGVTTDRKDEKLTLNFNQQIKFDLADAKAELPPTLESVEAETEHDSTAVIFVFNGKIDARTFREEKNYVVDVSTKGAKPKEAPAEASTEPVEAPAEAAAKEKVPNIEAPETVPSKAAAVDAKSPAASPAAPPSAPTAAPPAAPVAVKEKTPPPPAEVNKESAAPAPAPSPAPKAAASELPKSPLEAAAPAAAPASAPPAPAATPAAAAPPAAVAPVAQNLPSPVVSVPRQSSAAVKLELRRQGGNLTLVFPFGAPTPAAVFRRADTLWLVFDTEAKIDLSVLESDPSRAVRSAAVLRPQEGEAVVRIKLERPRLASMSSEGPGWAVTIGDTALEPTRPLGIGRNIVGPNRASITIPFEEPRTLHRIRDPEIGDTLMVVTAMGPARGFLKPQDFVELRTLASTHGVVIQPLADDINAELAADKVVISRPGGLILSQAAPGRQAGNLRTMMFDSQLWGFDRQADFSARQSELIQKAASSPQGRRTAARLDLARFYLARDMYAEAKAVLDVALSDEKPGGDDITGLVLKSVANVMLDRADEALRDLANPSIGNQYDAPIWRALAYARQGKWPESREGFRNVEVTIGALPIELQRLALQDAVRSSIEVRDFAGASKQLQEFETVGVPRELEPQIALLTGRLAEGFGRTDDALIAYRVAADSPNRRAASQGQLRELVLRYASGDLKTGDTIAELETLTTVWRGDETEIEGLQLLARLYTKENRYRNAFHVMRTALMAHPNSDMTRRIQDEAAATFDSLFLAGKGDALPPIDALGLFYDFRELTPIGRRGDEMIRRLADRLVSVDLLDQAAELLQHQVDHRLQGAARAQVATRLAVIYLMNRKADKAMATLRATRTAELSNELRNQRLLIEARALSDIGRYELALEVIASMDGREAIRLRSDILWAAKRWRDSAEQIELLYGQRWKDFEPLTNLERPDIMRAAIGFSLGEDSLGLARFREKYAAKMTDGADRRAFEVVSAPLGTSGAEFSAIAKTVAAVDTLDGFLRELRARYPETGVLSPQSPGASATPEPKSTTSPLPAKPQRGARLGSPQDDAIATGSIGPRLPKAVRGPR
jgi:predicted negative regulator of RcsB-dependent stress response